MHIHQAADVEIHVQDTLFSVHVNPYFLRLDFPHSLVQDDDAYASYDPSSGTLTVRLTKVAKGTHFPDLDLLAKLLAPRSAASIAEQGRARGPLVQVLDDHIDNNLRLDLDHEHAQFVRGTVHPPPPLP